MSYLNYLVGQQCHRVFVKNIFKGTLYKSLIGQPSKKNRWNWSNIYIYINILWFESLWQIPFVNIAIVRYIRSELDSTNPRWKLTWLRWTSELELALAQMRGNQYHWLTSGGKRPFRLRYLILSLQIFKWSNLQSLTSSGVGSTYLRRWRSPPAFSASLLGGRRLRNPSFLDYQCWKAKKSFVLWAKPSRVILLSFLYQNVLFSKEQLACIVHIFRMIMWYQPQSENAKLLRVQVRDATVRVVV